ncbi:tetratricopeptide repeat protein [Streptomyces bobili]|uniref:tetratricopeptide repeat protein n=1 Tax=Streptomyces bobili TaxID=67280 RepID=UPI00371215EC
MSVEKLTLVQQRVPQEPTAWPHQVGVIPSRAQSFQHRAEAERLRAAVEGGGTAVLSQVLTGMGGVGKTQLAADYARAAWEGGGLDVLVWVTASASSPVVAGYAQAGVELCRADPDTPEKAAKKFLAWLAPKAGQRPCRWLIVLDGVADPADLVVNPDDPENRYSLWPPASPYGRTLVTTRRRDAVLCGEGRHRIDIGLFTEAEAVAYLTTSLAVQGRVEPVDQLTALASDLGYLPLALSQAAAYLIDSGLGTAAYRDLLANRATTLAAAAPERLPDDQAVALAAAWSLSIDRADQLRPVGLARPMLQLAALLDPHGIPQDILTSQPALAHFAQHCFRTGSPSARRLRWWPGKRQRSPAQATREQAVGALRALHRLSLIDHTPDTRHQEVRVHQLIQRATRDTLTPEAFDQLARTAADALVDSWPDVEREAALGQALRANTTALTHSAEEALFRPEPHAVLYRAGESFVDSNQGTAARDYFESLAAAACRHLGSNHVYTLASRHNLAHCQGMAGDASGAVAAFAELLPDYVRVRGPDDPATLDVRYQYANWMGEAGDLSGAAAAFAELLPDHVRVLGPDDPDTLGVRCQSARWKGEAGDPSGAAAAFVELLPDYVRVRGPDDPTTLGVRYQSATWRGEAGDPSGAADAFEQLAGTMMRVLGLNDPSTQITLLHMAHWRDQAGDASLMGAVTDAFTLQTEAMARELGLNDSQAHAVPNADSWLKKAVAVMTLTEMLDEQNRALGSDHFDTLASRRNLAFLRGDTGDPSGAVAAFAELLPDYVRVLGPDDPNTLDVRYQCARWKGEAGDPSGAVAAFAELLPDYVRVLGPDDPNTLRVRFQSARWKGEAGDPAAATDAFEQLLPDSERVLGPMHPLVFATRSTLQRWRE